MRLYLEGHAARRGYIVSYELYDHPPLRFIESKEKAIKLISRYNRMFKDKYPNDEIKYVYERTALWESIHVYLSE